MVIFKDRASAGILLANRLKQYNRAPKTIVLGIPRGGVIVAWNVASVLKLPLDVLVARKIRDPIQPELALGALTGAGEIFWNQTLLEKRNLTTEDLEDEVELQKKTILEQQQFFRQGKPLLDLKGIRAIVVDDGIATGFTIKAALNYARSLGAKEIIAASPVASPEAQQLLLPDADNQVYLQIPADFKPVKMYYSNFDDVENDLVIQALSTL